MISLRYGLFLVFSIGSLILGVVYWQQSRQITSLDESTGCTDVDRWADGLKERMDRRLNTFVAANSLEEEQVDELRTITSETLDDVVAGRYEGDQDPVACLRTVMARELALDRRDEDVEQILGTTLAAEYRSTVLGIRGAEEESPSEQCEGGDLPAGLKTVAAGESVDAEVAEALQREASDSMDWMHIPGGSFWMGSERGARNERPEHVVEMPSFRLSKTEVTVGQFRRCVEAGVCAPPLDLGDISNWGKEGREDHPVNKVTWYQARDFCTWVGGRLPSEAEWEYAARSGGQEQSYPWGDADPTCELANMYEDGTGCGTQHTAEICAHPGGNTGQDVCDVAGNVWEWVQDTYQDRYVGGPTDGTAWEEESAGAERVVRGGGFGCPGRLLRSTFRFNRLPEYPCFGLGFRCAN